MTKNRMKVLAVANQKGGSGKSIMSYNMAWYFAEMMQKKVLFGDCDTQANSSSSLKKYESSLLASRFFSPEPLKINGSAGQISLARADNSLRPINDQVNDQRSVLNNFADRIDDVSGDFDICIFDTAGSDSIVTGAILHLADYVLIPTKLDSYGLDVTFTMLHRVDNLQKNLNTKLINLGVLVTQFDAVDKNQRRDIGVLLEKYPRLLVPAKISKRSCYPAAAEAGIPLWGVKSTSSREAMKEFQIFMDIICKKMGVEK